MEEEAAVAGSADTEAMSAMMESEESSGVGMGIATGDESAVKGGRKGSPTLDDSEDAGDVAFNMKTLIRYNEHAHTNTWVYGRDAQHLPYLQNRTACRGRPSKRRSS